MQKIKVGFLVVLVSLIAGFSSVGVILPPKIVTLTWNYPQSSPDIVFNVYHSASLALPMSSWSLLTNVTSTTCAFAAPAGDHFFTVTASNVVSGMESAPQ